MCLVFRTGQGVRHKTVAEMLGAEATIDGKWGTRGLRTQVQLSASQDATLPLCRRGMDTFSSWSFGGVAQFLFCFFFLSNINNLAWFPHNHLSSLLSY